MGVCKVISERSVLYVFTFSRRTFDHPFGSSDRRSILRGIRSCGSYRRCRRLTFRTSDCQFSSPRSILAARSSKYIQRSIFSSSCCSAASFSCVNSLSFTKSLAYFEKSASKVASEQNRCAMACQGCGAVFLLFLKKAVDYFLKSIYC